MTFRWLLMIGFFMMLVFMIVQLPTRFLVTVLPSMPGVQFSESDGSLWRGSVCVLSPMLPQKACGNWRWQSAALWSLNLEWQVTAKIGETQAFLLTQINDNQWLVNGLLKLPDTEPAPQWAQWLPAGTQAGEKKVNFSGKW